MIGKKYTLLLLLLILPVLGVPAQTSTTEIPTVMESNVPQWVKDLRRWEIVTFGSIPFAMFTATFAMDMYRWQQANGLDFSDAGRRYAPWPLKSAGAIAMTNKEMETTITIAASLSVAVGLADLIIVQVKRAKAKKRAEALPVGTAIIIRSPWGEEPEEAADDDAQATADDESSSGEEIPVTP